MFRGSPRDQRWQQLIDVSEAVFYRSRLSCIDRYDIRFCNSRFRFKSDAQARPHAVDMETMGNNNSVAINSAIVVGTIVVHESSVGAVSYPCQRTNEEAEGHGFMCQPCAFQIEL